MCVPPDGQFLYEFLMDIPAFVKMLGPILGNQRCEGWSARKVSRTLAEAMEGSPANGLRAEETAVAFRYLKNLAG